MGVWGGTGGASVWVCVAGGTHADVTAVCYGGRSTRRGVHVGDGTWGGVRTRPPAHPPPPPPFSQWSVGSAPAVPPSPRVTQRAHSASICPSVCVGRVRSPPPPPPSPPFLMQSSAGGGAGSWVAAFIHCPRPHSVLSEGKIKGGVQAETPTHSQEGGGRWGRPPRLGIRSPTAAASSMVGVGPALPPGVGVVWGCRAAGPRGSWPCNCFQPRLQGDGGQGMGSEGRGGLQLSPLHAQSPLKQGRWGASKQMGGGGW